MNIFAIHPLAAKHLYTQGAAPLKKDVEVAIDLLGAIDELSDGFVDIYHLLQLSQVMSRFNDRRFKIKRRY